MNKADIKIIDVINGIGLRLSLFVSGCNIHCKNCFNPSCQNFDYGTKFTSEDMNNIIDIMNKNKVYEGLSILGGEPFDNVGEIIEYDENNITGIYQIIKHFKEKTNNEFNIWVWSGHTYEELLRNEKTLECLKLIDVLVDGPFIDELKDLSLHFRGSNNQRIIDVQKSLSCKEVILYNA